MDKYRQIADGIRSIAEKAVENRAVLFPAIVKEITDDSCTVTVNNGQLELTDVRLKTTINGKTATNKLLIIPEENSQVLVASLSGDLRDLAVVKVDKVSKIEYVQNGLDIAIVTPNEKAQENKLTIYIDAESKKIAFENNEVGLFQLFTDLSTLLHTFQVTTPAGPSGSILEPTKKLLDKFKEDFGKLIMKAPPPDER